MGSIGLDNWFKHTVFSLLAVDVLGQRRVEPIFADAPDLVSSSKTRGPEGCRHEGGTP